MSRAKKIIADPVTPLVSQEEYEKLIIDNINFVYKVVNDNFSNYSWNIKQELYSAGKRGLVVAATKFDPSNYENKFIAYAVSWIKYYIHEEIRILYPVKLNQNFLYKRNKVNSAIKQFEDENGKQPTAEELSKIVGMSTKVIGNIMSINKGKDFQFVSFQTASSNSDSESEDYVGDRLTYEHFDEEDENSAMSEYELTDLLDVLQKKIPQLDYKIFVDKYMNDMSYSDIARKYNLPFASSVSYLIKKSEKVCKELLD
jgi:RNA polymerase sigma factor (sigma-70 family)